MRPHIAAGGTLSAQALCRLPSPDPASAPTNSARRR